MALSVGDRLGHYDVTALIGEGGMGQVYRARDTTLHERGQGYDRPMLTGSRDGLLRKIQPISIHGQISWDVYYTYADDPKEQVAMARVGPESMDRGLEPGDRIRLHLVLGAVTDITRTDEPAA